MIAIVISGCSAAGKTTIIRKFLEKRQDFYLSKSYTSRKPRSKDDNEYIFISESEFQQRIKHGFFFETVKIFGNYYGTAISDLKKEKIIFNKDIYGAKTFQSSLNCSSIFINPPSIKSLKERMIHRDGILCTNRMSRIQEELAATEHFDYIIINDQLTESVKQLEHIINLIEYQHQARQLTNNLQSLMVEQIV